MFVRTPHGSRAARVSGGFAARRQGPESTTSAVLAFCKLPHDTKSPPSARGSIDSQAQLFFFFNFYFTRVCRALRQPSLLSLGLRCLPDKVRYLPHARSSTSSTSSTSTSSTSTSSTSTATARRRDCAWNITSCPASGYAQSERKRSALVPLPHLPLSSMSVLLLVGWLLLLSQPTSALDKSPAKKKWQQRRHYLDATPSGQRS